MKITFIGTSHGVPSNERYCSCILLEIGESFYFIDAGAPVADIIQRRGLDWKNFKAIFTTHAHGDHTAGIFQAADLMNWYYKNSSADIFLTDDGQIETYKKLIYYSNNNCELDSSRVRFHLASEGVVYDDGIITVKYIQNKHMASTPSYSVLVCADGKSLLLGGDMSNNLCQKDVPTDALRDGVDVFVCELAHFALDDLLPYIESAKIGKMFVTHVYPLSKYESVEAAKGKYQFEIFTPSDGDGYEIN